MNPSKVGSCLAILLVAPLSIQADAASRHRPVSGRQAQQIAQQLNSGAQFAPVEAQSSRIGECTSRMLQDGATLATQRLNVARPVYEPIAANTSGTVLWPGALVQLGPFVNDGALNGIPLARTGGRVFITSLAANADPATGQASRANSDVSEFRASDVDQVRRNLLANSAATASSQFAAGFSSFSSLSQLAFRFNGSASAFGTSFEAQLSSDEYRENNNEAIVFYQPIYSYATEDLQGSSVFARGVTAESLLQYSSASNPVGYISSVTYGRMAVLTVSSSRNQADVRAAARLASGFLVGSLDAEAERRAREVINQSSTRVWVYGFGMESNAINQAPDRAAALRTAMSDSGPMVLRSALPLFYRVNHLSNNQGVAVKLATEFDTSVRGPVALVDRVRISVRMGNNDGDNKDWDTGLGFYLINRVNSMQEMTTRPTTRAMTIVPKGRNGEGSWQARRTFELPLTISDRLEWSALSNLSLLVSQDSTGEDQIVLTPTIIADSAVGGTYRYTTRALSFPRFPYGVELVQITGAVPTPANVTCSNPTDEIGPTS